MIHLKWDNAIRQAERVAFMVAQSQRVPGPQFVIQSFIKVKFLGNHTFEPVVKLDLIPWYLL